jgi:hypothetical protein
VALMPDQSIPLAPRSVLPVMSHGAAYHAFTAVARTFAVPDERVGGSLSHQRLRTALHGKGRVARVRRVLGEGPLRKRYRCRYHQVTCEVYRRTNRYIVITGNPLPGASSQLVNIDAYIDRTVIELDAEKKAKRKETLENKEQAENDLGDLIRNGCGARFGGDRSRAVWFVVNEMLRCGDTPERIITTILDPANKISAGGRVGLDEMDKAEPGRWRWRQCRPVSYGTLCVTVVPCPVQFCLCEEVPRCQKLLGTSWSELAGGGRWSRDGTLPFPADSSSPAEPL